MWVFQLICVKFNQQRTASSFILVVIVVIVIVVVFPRANCWTASGEFCPESVVPRISGSQRNFEIQPTSVPWLLKVVKGGESGGLVLMDRGKWCIWGDVCIYKLWLRYIVFKSSIIPKCMYTYLHTYLLGTCGHWLWDIVDTSTCRVMGMTWLAQWQFWSRIKQPQL